MKDYEPYYVRENRHRRIFTVLAAIGAVVSVVFGVALVVILVARVLGWDP